MILKGDLYMNDKKSVLIRLILVILAFLAATALYIFIISRLAT